MKTAISTTGRRNKGFAYIAVLAALLVVVVLAERAVLLESTASRREMEAELLFRGQAYRNAIRSYYHARTPAAYPRRLEDLFSDPRFLHRRHLRQLYPDPTGAGWRELRNERGEIIGVASRSEAKPLKTANFEPALAAFEGAERYADWVFDYLPGRPTGAPLRKK